MSKLPCVSGKETVKASPRLIFVSSDKNEAMPLSDRTSMHCPPLSVFNMHGLVTFRFFALYSILWDWPLLPFPAVSQAWIAQELEIKSGANVSLCIHRERKKK